ncbi:MAG: anti-sigma factor [Thermomicrobiales bacterium]
MSDQPTSTPLSAMPDGMAEAIAAYALDALPPDEEATVAAYLAAHPEARALCEEYRSIVGLLPYAAAPSEPPPYIREGVLRTIRSERTTRRRFSLPPVRYRFISAFAACALALLLVWNIGLQVRTSPAPANASASISDILSQPGLMTYAMEPQPAAPNASGRVYLTPGLKQAAISVWKLPPLPPDHTYQLWFQLDAQTRVSITTFSVDAKGSAVVRLDVPRMNRPYVQCGITLEPQGGSPTPTGPRMLSSQEWSVPSFYGQ